MEISPSIEDTVRGYGTEILAAEKVQQARGYRQHGNTSIFEHSMNVAGLSLRIARRMKLRVDERAMVRGALLHDYFQYDWHEKSGRPRWHGFRHAGLALKNAAQEFELGEVERDVIAKHMFPLTVVPPACAESAVVCLADKLCAIAEMFT